MPPKASPKIQARNSEWCRMFLLGKTHTEIASAFGVSAGLVSGVTRKAGISRHEGGKEARCKILIENGEPRTPRHEEIKRLYESGLPFVEIASQLGVSGSSVRKCVRLVKLDRLKHESSLFARKRGVDVSEFESLEAAKEAHTRFAEHATRARQRGVGFELTFAEWWGIWKDSGMWGMRGRSESASAVMARDGDKGPYKVGNVRITTLLENFNECAERRISAVKSMRRSTCNATSNRAAEHEFF